MATPSKSTVAKLGILGSVLMVFSAIGGIAVKSSYPALYTVLDVSWWIVASLTILSIVYILRGDDD